MIKWAVLFCHPLTMSGKSNMTKKVLYGFNCPFSKYTKRISSKVGITGNGEVRLGVYQNSFSKDNHTACFDVAYVGPANAVDNLERAIKRIYDWNIDRTGRGHSEWIGGLTAEDISVMIDKLIKEDGYLLRKVDKKFLPLTVDNYEEFCNEYLGEEDGQS